MDLVESTAEFVEFLRCSIPEKHSHFDSLVSELGVTFLLDESTYSKVFRAYPETKEIRIGQKGAERLWAHAYGYSATFLAMAWKEYRGGIPFEANVNAALADASELLTWSVRADMALKDNGSIAVPDQPNSLPSPFDPSDDETVLSLAQSLWCQALCFILFHEIAHLQLGHSSAEAEAVYKKERDPEKKNELLEKANELLSLLEKDADREAARWLLEDTDGTARRQLERGLGIATALLYLSTTDVYLPASNTITAPPGYDRLFQTLSQYFFDDESEDSEQVWAFVSSCLMLHIRNKEISLDDIELKGSWLQIANILVDVLANREAE